MKTIAASPLFGKDLVKVKSEIDFLLQNYLN